MKKLIRTIFYPALLLFSCKEIKTKPKNIDTTMNSQTFYELRATAIDGKEINFSQYKGKKIMIVNTASECGYTPQYKQLQELHKKFGNKLVILGFPANNFGAQEPGTNTDIASFCEKNYGVTFQLFEKSDVIGEHQNSVYQWLTQKEKNGWNTDEPKWNFWKYLIDENGELTKVYSHAIDPASEEVLKEIE